MGHCLLRSPDPHHEDLRRSCPLRCRRFGVHHHPAGPYRPVPPHDGQEPRPGLRQDCWWPGGRAQLLPAPGLPAHRLAVRVRRKHLQREHHHHGCALRRWRQPHPDHRRRPRPDRQRALPADRHLYLDSPLTFTAEIDSIALAQAEPAVGDDVNMAGWGKTCDQFNCGVSDVVNQVTVPVLDDSVADEYYGTLDWDRIICIDTTGGMGTCNGDSGGPLMVGDANGPLTGVTSFGSIFGCEVGAPACFTSIPNYLDWLNENGNRK